MPAMKRCLPSKQVSFDDSPSGQEPSAQEQYRVEPSAQGPSAQKPMEQIAVGEGRDGKTRVPLAEAPSAIGKGAEECLRRWDAFGGARNRMSSGGSWRGHECRTYKCGSGGGVKSSVGNRTAGHEVAHGKQAVTHHCGNGIHAACGCLSLDFGGEF
ncbi:hypothetical protein AXG93_3001s1030 [Marchantia polymorpha subsp. ruderalis]|uniref:Uncharacterized protein n=1 Tax=Marchantia polymorpha subsp. ruderalis TaxID=1480154 RepID=A0A176VSQ4_MARPO|nr:hypothetical protein AXG93_3001s1030 [Marchantia polymorpha subsp. ruderalis]